MKSIKTLILGGLIAGTVLATGTAAMARDHDRWDNRWDNRYENHWYSRDSYRGNYNGYRGNNSSNARDALTQARQKYEYDQSRGAGHSTMDADQKEINRIEQSMGGGWFNR